MSYHFGTDISTVPQSIVENAIKKIKEQNLNPELMCTITTENYDKLDEICKKTIDLGVGAIRLFNCINTGKCESNCSNLCLNEEQTKYFFKQLIEMRKKYSEDILKIKRNGLFGKNNYNPDCNFKCIASIDEVVITPDVNVYPCIFMTKPGYEIGHYENGKILLDCQLDNNSNSCIAHDIFNKNEYSFSKKLVRSDFMGWYEVYLKDISKKGNLENYVDDKIRNKKILIDLIKKYAKGNKLIESGSGTGVLSTYMSSLGYDVTGVDIDKDILNLSNKIAKSYNSKNKPIFKRKSIFELDYKKNYFDISFSNGVLEHFNDEQIIDTLRQQMKIAKIVIFGIPTKYFKQEEAMYGDERYKSNRFWRNLINISGGIILEEKSMHYMSRMKRILNYKKYFRPYPYRIFVIKSKNNV